MEIYGRCLWTLLVLIYFHDMERCLRNEVATTARVGEIRVSSAKFKELEQVELRVLGRKMLIHYRLARGTTTPYTYIHRPLSPPP